MSEDNDLKKEYVDELKDEGIKIFKYFSAASTTEKLALLTFVAIVFVAGAIIF